MRRKRKKKSSGQIKGIKCLTSDCILQLGENSKKGWGSSGLLVVSVLPALEGARTTLGSSYTGHTPFKNTYVFGI